MYNVSETRRKKKNKEKTRAITANTHIKTNQIHRRVMNPLPKFY